MKRSDFIKQVAGGSALVLSGALPLSSFNSVADLKHVTILHTNDTHSHIDPFKFLITGFQVKVAYLEELH